MNVLDSIKLSNMNILDNTKSGQINKINVVDGMTFNDFAKQYHIETKMKIYVAENVKLYTSFKHIKNTRLIKYDKLSTNVSSYYMDKVSKIQYVVYGKEAEKEFDKHLCDDVALPIEL